MGEGASIGLGRRWQEDLIHIKTTRQADPYSPPGTSTWAAPARAVSALNFPAPPFPDTIAPALRTLLERSGLKPLLLRGRELLPIVQGGMGIGVSAHRLA
ncbi:MAG TPA: hypothetical protein VJ743_17610, partial [Albitalea sp.]|nr:hypothetical protein [Albitalea sp.]